jgi:hypothetical protein
MTPSGRPEPDGDSWRMVALKQLEEKGDAQHRRCGHRISFNEQAIDKVTMEVRALSKEVRDGYVSYTDLRKELEVVTERYALRMKLLDGIVIAILIAVAGALWKVIAK